MTFLQTFLMWINTGFSFVALSFSFIAVNRDRARIAIDVNHDWNLTDLEEKLIVISVTNVGRRDVVYNMPSLLRPDGMNCHPQSSVGFVTLKEGEVRSYTMDQIRIETWLEDYTLDDLQGLVIDSTGRRWYSKQDKISQKIKFLCYRLMRKIRARSFLQI